MNTWLDREPLPLDLPNLTGRMFLVTGGAGHIGRCLVPKLLERGAGVKVLDLPEYDVLKPRSLAWENLPLAEYDAIIHLAAHKEAIVGEETPAAVADLNVRGTALVADLGLPVVLASTCKAVDPCTAYGASKLIAERIVLNAGGVVMRLVNVLGSSRSVIPIWADIPEDEPLPVTMDERMWITDDEAVGLLITSLRFIGEGGVRLIPDCGPAEPVAKLALRVHGDRAMAFIDDRRGDRPVERLVGEYETASAALSGLRRVTDHWETPQASMPPLPGYLDAEPLIGLVPQAEIDKALNSIGGTPV